MIALTENSDGVLLPVRAHPGARADGIRGIHNGALKVSVTQVAEKGKANKAITQLLCKKLGLRRSQVTLAAGETSSEKLFLVRDVTRAELASRINALL